VYLLLCRLISFSRRHVLLLSPSEVLHDLTISHGGFLSIHELTSEVLLLSRLKLLLSILMVICVDKL
ncbi:hypothetical protein A2U01_0052680, partial [Trifolium medium]|nr:hypothetical protein [Trifolium medium]